MYGQARKTRQKHVTMKFDELQNLCPLIINYEFTKFPSIPRGCKTNWIDKFSQVKPTETLKTICWLIVFCSLFVCSFFCDIISCLVCSCSAEKWVMTIYLTLAVNLMNDTTGILLSLFLMITTEQRKILLVKYLQA